VIDPGSLRATGKGFWRAAPDNLRGSVLMVASIVVATATMAGIKVIGARLPLVAFNVNLRTADLGIARRIAAVVRERNGGLPAVKALGVPLAERGLVQVTMNLTNYERTSLAAAFAAVAGEAEREGVAVEDSEIVGLVPEGALAGVDPSSIGLKRFSPNQILEHRLRAVV